jgi:GH43 family beta-xylosidase
MTPAAENAMISIIFRMPTIILVIFLSQTGYAQSLDYDNPIVKQRADPWIHKDTDGMYYFIATVPEYDRIELRMSETINGLGTAGPKVIWRKHETGEMGSHIWAPELHKINGIWYIYFAAGGAEVETQWDIRMYVLSNTSANPMEGEWVEEGRIMTDMDAFALDATTFEHNGKRYLVWAEITPEQRTGSSLFIAEMADPVTLTGPQVVISRPTFDWETVVYEVNEGAAIIRRNGMIFITYSASTTDHNYAMGMLWTDEDANLLDAASWHKSPEPVFFTNEAVHRFGPGHNSCTVAEDGETDLLVYHARDYKDIEGHPLGDPNRHTRVRVLYWTDDGFPDFRQEEGD